MSFSFKQRIQQRKPLSRILLNSNIQNNKNSFLSNIDDYLHFFVPKKCSKNNVKIITTLNNLRSRKNNIIYTNPQYVYEYFTEISSYLINIDKTIPILYGYMSKQPEINPKMRAILIDWLVDVHLKFKLTKETLYITVNIIDKYLSEEKIQRNKLQLIEITSMFIACKYEEIYPPKLKDHVYITDQTYTKEDIILMELSILAKLNFDVTFISNTFSFLRNYKRKYR